LVGKGQRTVTFNQIGNILSTPRTLKLQAGVRF